MQLLAVLFVFFSRKPLVISSNMYQLVHIVGVVIKVAGNDRRQRFPSTRSVIIQFSRIERETTTYTILVVPLRKSKALNFI